MRFGEILLALALAGAAYSADRPYRAVRIDDAGQLFLQLERGGEAKAPKLPDQVGFDAGLVTADGKTVAWVAMYPDPDGGEPLAQRLVLYRNGRVLRSFSTEEVIWSWQFATAGRDVAYCTGPTHGGATACKLKNITTGHLVALWQPVSGRKAPSWMSGLRY